VGRAGIRQRRRRDDRGGDRGARGSGQGDVLPPFRAQGRHLARGRVGHHEGLLRGRPQGAAAEPVPGRGHRRRDGASVPSHREGAAAGDAADTAGPGQRVRAAAGARRRRPLRLPARLRADHGTGAAGRRTAADSHAGQPGRHVRGDAVRVAARMGVRRSGRPARDAARTLRCPARRGARRHGRRDQQAVIQGQGVIPAGAAGAPRCRRRVASAGLRRPRCPRGT